MRRRISGVFSLLRKFMLPCPAFPGLQMRSGATDEDNPLGNVVDDLRVWLRVLQMGIRTALERTAHRRSEQRMGAGREK
jgi:hypothetical protein